MVSNIREVEVTIHKSKIGETFCTCPNGKSSPCSHRGTLLLYIYRNVSCTDQAAAWSKKKLLHEPETQTIEEMLKRTTVNKIDECKKSEIRKKCEIALKDASLTVPCVWLLKPEPTSIEDDLESCNDNVELRGMDLENILLSAEFAMWDDKRAVLKECFELDNEQIRMIANETVGQWTNERFIRMKKFRLTASNFGFVAAAVHRNSFPPSLYKRLLNTANLEKVQAIQWGRQHEETAFKILQKYNVTKDVQKAGIYLHETGLLGASPDGIGEKYVAEIKCPFKYRDDDLKDVLTLKEKYVVYYDSTGEICLNTDHEYYHQVQGQIYLCKKEVGYLCIYTPKSHLVIKVLKDKGWAPTIDLLLEFYYNKFIDYILSNIT